MYTGGEDESSSDDEFMSANSCPTRFCDQGIFTVSQEKSLQKSYFDMTNDVSLRCGYSEKFIQATSIEKNSTNEDALVCSNTPAQKPIPNNISNFIFNREMGYSRGSSSKVPFISRPYTGSFTCGQRVFLNNQFIPNQRRRVDVVKSKTFCVSYIDNGEGLLTASQDHRLRLYRRKGPRRRFIRTKFVEVPYVGWSILDVCVSPDGRDVIYSTWNDNIYQCSITGNDKDEYWQPFRVNPKDSRFAIFSLRFNNNGSEIVAGSTDGLYIYNREVNRCVLSIQAHEDDINAVCFGDHSSHIILSGADDGLCKVWDRRTMGEFMYAKPVGVFAGHRDGITFIDSRGDDRYLLTNSKDQTIKVWDLRHFSSEAGISSTKHAVSNQKWDYRWQCTPDSIFKMTNLAGDSSLLTIRGHSVLNTLIRARFSPDHTGKRYIYTGCARGNCIVYDLYSGELLKKYPGHKSVVRDCMWHPTENEIVTSAWDGETSLWKYDERAARNINPDSYISGDEDSCDENYQPIRQRYRMCRRDRCHGKA
uniref:Uncharacterized protein n=1 Tax=Acrobeloides nanus TaxID=290746 RepID=A0A914ELB6_9BILA